MTTISSFSSLINYFYAKRDHCLQIITDQNISFGFSRFTLEFIYLLGIYSLSVFVSGGLGEIG